ncbi:MAG TPA: two-component system response regulator [Phycisphaerales bacterium]|nr:two-component system response regulator [Phycisphaerales bacterium]HCD33734.1 two-component system response regulator [Phycisphaerales bacterium]|tara:strand:- start:610 stop:1017 length:408 start_codon:yes stop_codon:yes gene_type:complete
MSLKKILIADDEPNIRLLVQTTLEGPDRQMVEASSGPEVLELARKHVPDLIILDWLMPGLHGIDVAARLRSERKTAHIPIIMLTCKSQPADMQQGREAGVNTYLVKPFSPMELLERVQEALSTSMDNNLLNQPSS